jgi:HAD superfamily hydrolase (TIGR01509 family)
MTRAPIHGNLGARVWLFDFDNTLAALEKQVDWAASRRELESFLRSERIDEAVLREYPARNLPLYDALLSRLTDNREARFGTGFQPVTAELMRRASAIIESHELHGVEGAAPLPGAKELLGALRMRAKCTVIVTSNSSRTVKRWLARYDLEAEIGGIIGRDSLLPLKPAPEMIRRALELTDGDEGEAVFVGDSEADLCAAHNAGVGFFGVAANPQARTRLESLGARDVFSSPDNLMRHLGFGADNGFVLGERQT